MSFNLIDLVKDNLGKEIAGQLSSSLGADKSKVSGALDSAIPTLLGGLLNKGTSEKGAGELLDFMGEQKLDSLLSGNIGSLLSNGDKSSAISKSGLGILSYLFGGDSKVTNLINLFGKTSGLGASSGGGLLKMVAPFILSSVGKYAKSKALGATGLASLFAGQQGLISKAIPSEIGKEFGLVSSAGAGHTASAAASSSKSASAATVSQSTSSGDATYIPPKASGGGSGLGKFLPLLLGLLGLMFVWNLVKGGKEGPEQYSNVQPVETPQEVVVEEVAEAAVEEETVVADNQEEIRRQELLAKQQRQIEAEAAAARERAAQATASAQEQAPSATEQAANTISNAAEGGKNKAMELASGAAGMIQGGVATVSETLGSLSLPGGTVIETPKGSFTEKIVNYLSSGEAKSGAEKTFDFDRVNFETGSANLTADSSRQVSNLASILSAYPEISIRVEGHTDNTGNADANRTLSQKRADQVRSNLVSKGVAAERLAAMGKGQESPIADNNTEDGRAENRRVSVVVTGSN